MIVKVYLLKVTMVIALEKHELTLICLNDSIEQSISSPCKFVLYILKRKDKWLV